MTHRSTAIDVAPGRRPDEPHRKMPGNNSPPNLQLSGSPTLCDDKEFGYLKAMEEVHFLFNNLTHDALYQAAASIKMFIDVFGDKFRVEFAGYLVSKRVLLSMELHSLYGTFLDVLNDLKLNKLIKTETLSIIEVLLKFDKEKTDADIKSRQYLKLLGHFFGIITIAMNKPILNEDLDLREILIDAFNKGQQDLMYVVPFVAKVIASSANSLYFAPSCAYVRTILLVLGEVYRWPPLRFSSKFEIEILFQHLNVNLDEMLNLLVMEPDRCKLHYTEVVTAKTESNIVNLNWPKSNSSSQLCKEPTPPSTPTTLPSCDKDHYPTKVYAYNEVDIYQPFSIFFEVPRRVAFDRYPQLIQIFKGVFDAAIQQHVQDVVDQCVSVAATLTSDIIRMDFSTCSDPIQVHRSFVLMIRSMTVSIAMASVREHLAKEVTKMMDIWVEQNLKSKGRHTDRPLIDDSINAAVMLNIDMASHYVAKIACERAMANADSYLKNLFDPNGTREDSVFPREIPATIQAIIDSLPDQLRPKNRELDVSEMKVFEAFNGCDNFFMAESIENVYATFVQPRNHPTKILISDFDQLVFHLQYFTQRIQLVASTPASSSASIGFQLIASTVNLFLQQPTAERLPVILDSLIDHFLNHYTTDSPHNDLLNFFNSFITCIRITMKAFQAHDFLLVSNRVVIDHCNRAKYNIPALEVLLRYQIISNFIVDQHLSQQFDRFYGPLVHPLFVLMAKPKSLNVPPDVGYFQSMLPLCLRKMKSASGKKEPKEKAAPLETPIASKDHSTCISKPTGSSETPDYVTEIQTKLAPVVLLMLPENGANRNLDVVMKLLKKCLCIVIDIAYSHLQEGNQGRFELRYQCAVDTFSRVTCALIKNCGHVAATDKATLLFKSLQVIAQVLVENSNENQAKFNGLPFHRIVLAMFVDLCEPESPNKAKFLMCFAHFIHSTEPRTLPRFTFQWLDIVGNKSVIGCFVADPQATPNIRLTYVQFLLFPLKYIAQLYMTVGVSSAVEAVYRATLRMTCVLLHDFPDFLSDYCEFMCQVVPLCCIQLRNLLMSAHPSTIHLPSPFCVPFAIIEQDSLMITLPRVPIEMFSIIPTDLRAPLEAYLSLRDDVNFLPVLHAALKADTPFKYDVSLFDAVICFIGVRGAQHFVRAQQTISVTSIADTAQMDVFHHLVTAMQSEGRLLMINSLVNNLRYPNAHTHFFACSLLHLFSKYPVDEGIKEQITRVFTERIIVRRPHPWGMLVVCSEIMSNPTYDFWSNPFVSFAPEVKRLFINMATSLNVAIPDSYLNKCPFEVTAIPSSPPVMPIV